MRFIAAALIATLAALPSRALDWNVTDPGAGADFAAAPDTLAGPVAGRFDSYVLALEWTPEFCETHQAEECATMTADRWDARNLALHGLWPDQAGDDRHAYGYCGVPKAVKDLDRSDTWCRMPATGASDATLAALSIYMPGTTSCLQNHEWYKHGTCSGLPVDDYFFQASALTAAVAATAVGRFVSANVGKTVSAEDFRAAFDQAFGAGARGKVSLNCAKLRGQDMLAEVRLSLPPRLLPAERLGEMLLPTGAGSCPASFVIDAVQPR